MIKPTNKSTPVVPSTTAVIDFAYANGKDSKPRGRDFGFSDRGDRKAAASLITAVKALAIEENGETTEAKESVPVLKMPVPRKAPLSKISTLTLPTTTFQEMVNHKIYDKWSESDYSPNSSPVSPTNVGADVNFYSPVENPWGEGKLFSVSNLQELAMKKIFFDAAKEFSDGLDVESLFEDVHTLEDHDAMKVADSMYELEPHRARARCHCHHCEVAKNAVDLEEHDRNLWCPCTKCEVWKIKEDRRLDEETVEKEANSWRRSMRALKPHVSSVDPSACVDQTDLNFMDDDSDSVAGDKSKILGGLFCLIRSNLETDDEEEEDDDGLWAQKLQCEGRPRY